MEPPPRDILRVMMATDNHLGYLVNDPIRGEDSFNTMDEILQMARDNHCDMVVLGGDLFHDNKPSRRTMHLAQNVFKKHVFGDGPVNIKVVSDQALNFGDRVVNYEDPNLSVQLPIFIIHGNHDDPTREGTHESLSALDLLADAGLVNYFGRGDTATCVKVRPVLIEKGSAKLCLYGLGWLRDEKLNNMFTKNQVSFLQPSEAQTEWFNMFLIHQNREDRGRGLKNAVAEKMIPSFMHLVMWGHEHGCEIDPIQREAGWYFSQPGSSVACSLVEHEAIPKHVGVLEIRLNAERVPEFQLIKQSLTSVRPFMMVDDLQLDAQEEALPPSLAESAKAESVYRFLTERVMAILNEYDKTPEGRAKVLPLVRLKVEHTGFPTVNADRFGAQFGTRVANSNEMLLFWKRKTAASARARGSAANGKRGSGGGGDDDDDDDDDEAQRILNISPQEMIARLVEEQFEDDAKMELLNPKMFNEALDAFVAKDENAAISEFVEQAMDSVRQQLRKEKDVRDEATVKEAVSRVAERQRRETDVAGVGAAKAVKTTAPKAPVAGGGGLSDDDDDALFAAEGKKVRAATLQPKKKASPAKKRKSSDDDDDDDYDDAAPPAKKRRKAAVSDDDDDEEEAPPPRKKAPAAKSARSTLAAATKQKKKAASDEDFSADDDAAEPPKPKAKAKGPAAVATVVAKPAASAKPLNSFFKPSAEALAARAGGDDNDDGNDSDVVMVEPPPKRSVAAPAKSAKAAARVDDDDDFDASLAAPLSQMSSRVPLKLGLKLGKDAKKR